MNRIINKINIILLAFGFLFVTTGVVLGIIDLSSYQASTIRLMEIFTRLTGLFLLGTFTARVLYNFISGKKQISKENKEKYIDSIYDKKTKLYNRSYLKTNFTEIFDNNPAIFKNCICAFIDIDNYNVLKSEFGLDEADHTLKKIGDIISSSKREGDFAFSFVEQEFLIFYMNTEQEFINKKLSDLKEVFNNFTKKEYPSDSVNFTLSIGTAKYSYGEDLSDIIHRANKAMYVSKYTGKDKVTNLS
ncbi:MAG: GGDEF domain-containing protein [Spirochaetaceae bacterium]